MTIDSWPIECRGQHRNCVAPWTTEAEYEAGGENELKKFRFRMGRSIL